jgi:hypothetical protein
MIDPPHKDSISFYGLTDVLSDTPGKRGVVIKWRDRITNGKVIEPHEYSILKLSGFVKHPFETQSFFMYFFTIDTKE